jgi:hypothetical protein
MRLSDKIAYGPNGNPIDAEVAANYGLAIRVSHNSNTIRRKALGSELGSSGTSTHQQQHQVPVGGMLCDVQMEFYNDSTTNVFTVVAHAMAAGDTYGALNPSGAWTVGAANLLVPVTVSAIEPTVVRTPSQRIYFPNDVVNPKWSTAFTRSSHTNGRIFGTNATSTYDTIASKFKSRCDYHPIVNVNDAFPNPPSSSAIGNVGLRSSTLILRPVSAFSARTVAGIGDSRTRGDGSTSNEFGWAPRAVESIASEFDDLVGYENWGVSGTNSTQFMERFNLLMSNSLVDLLYFQPASSNDTNPWTEAVVDACITRLAAVKAECKRRGIAFFTSTMYPSFAADTVAKALQWQRMNDHVRKTYPGEFADFADSALTDRSGAYPVLRATYQADPQHANDAGQAIMRDIAIPAMKRLLGLVAV